MSIIIFIIILGALIFVHELGHFIVAKKSGIRVDEFAIGFPPKIFGFRKGETDYALNLIPFGGYVKIFGENPDDESLDPNAKDSFVNKSKLIQAAVLVAGVAFNIIFAWLLFSISFMTGFPSVVTDETRDRISDVNVVVTDVLENSPAASIGLQVGDQIVAIKSEDNVLDENLKIPDVQNFIANNQNGFTLEYFRGENIQTSYIVPADGIVEGKPAIGISMDMIGSLKLPIHKAFAEGLKMTGQVTRDIAIGLYTFIGHIFVGKANLEQVAGPVGIVSLVGNAAQFGFIYLLGFTAFISLNLAVLNLIPFPALDGGRLLFILIEAITRKSIPTKVANVTNAIGFAILILLMVVITISDVVKLF
ncbi:RIP metalloprotease RseP [Candidatus Nomurabacteria bacterium]|nr:RIP metalloprotease RseP [Candidatus Nomurabacteria bacterium]